MFSPTERLLHPFFAVVHDRQHPVELVQRRLERVAVLGDEALYLLGHGGEVVRDLVQRLALSSQLDQQRVGVVRRVRPLRRCARPAPSSLCWRWPTGFAVARRVCRASRRIAPRPALRPSGRAGCPEKVSDSTRSESDNWSVFKPADRGRQVAQRVGQLIGRAWCGSAGWGRT